MNQKNVLYALPVMAIASFSADLAVGFDGALASAGSAMKGIADVDGETGVMLTVDVMGTSVCTAGAAFAKDAELEVGAGGKLVTKAAGIVVARSLEAATADGDKVEVLLLPK